MDNGKKSSIRGCRGSDFSFQGVAFGLDTLLILTDRKAYKLKDYFYVNRIDNRRFILW